MGGGGRWALAVLAALLTSLMLAGCADDSDRRFANDPLPDEALTSPSPAPDLEQGPTPTQAAALPQVSPQALLVARGAPGRLFFLQGTALWSISSDGTDARLILDPGAGRVVAVAPSPAANEVAVLLTLQRQGDANDASLLILDAGGRELQRWDGLEPPASAATGEIGMPGITATTLDWSPQGDHLLAVTGGRLWSIPLPGGEPTPLALHDNLIPVAAAWSPAGGAVAFIASRRGTEDATALYVASTGAPALDAVAVAPRQADGTRPVVDVAWRPDGSSILFTQSGASGSVGAGRDLFSISPGGENLQLVASAGRIAPSARVSEVVPSPDGRAVAYTIWVPVGERLTFHSLWVQPLAGGAGYQVPVPAGQIVTQAGWTNRGLVFRTIHDDPIAAAAYNDAAFAFYRIDRDGQPVQIYEADPSKTASPVASPASSPVDSFPARATPGSGGVSPSTPD